MPTSSNKRERGQNLLPGAVLSVYFAHSQTHTAMNGVRNQIATRYNIKARPSLISYLRPEANTTQEWFP